eukprot:PhF_6_TR13559/c0_g1_i1/m.21674
MITSAVQASTTATFFYLVILHSLLPVAASINTQGYILDTFCLARYQNRIPTLDLSTKDVMSNPGTHSLSCLVHSYCTPDSTPPGYVVVGRANASIAVNSVLYIFTPNTSKRIYETLRNFSLLSDGSNVKITVVNGTLNNVSELNAIDFTISYIAGSMPTGMSLSMLLMCTLVLMTTFL